MTVSLPEKVKIVGCFAPISQGAGAWVGKPIDMRYYERVTFLIYAGVADSTGLVTVEKGTTSSLGTAIAYNYRAASAGTAAYSVLDGAVVAATTTGIAMGVLPLDNGIAAIDIKASELGTSSWVGIKVAGSGSASLVCIIALCYDARYAEDIPPTSIS